jgi:hypothetical protein
MWTNKINSDHHREREADTMSSPKATAQQIQCLEIYFPSHVSVSVDAKEFVADLLAKYYRDRLGTMSDTEVKNASFFKRINWGTLTKLHHLGGGRPTTTTTGNNVEEDTNNAMMMGGDSSCKKTTVSTAASPLDSSPSMLKKSRSSSWGVFSFNNNGGIGSNFNGGSSRNNTTEEEEDDGSAAQSAMKSFVVLTEPILSSQAADDESKENPCLNYSESLARAGLKLKPLRLVQNSNNTFHFQVLTGTSTIATTESRS